MSSEATVAAADIARLAGVGRAAVSNWRRRFGDFPEPVGGNASSPLYRLDDVERWLAAHGRAIEVLARDRLWQWLRTEIDDLDLGVVVGDLGAFAVLLHRAPDVWSTLAALPDDELARELGTAVSAVVPDVPGVFPSPTSAQFVTAARMVADIAAADDVSSIFRFLAERYLDAHVRRLPTTSVETARLVVRLADVGGGSVFDPACGTGALLMAAEEAGGDPVAGQEIDGATARVAAAQLLLRRVDAQVAVGDSLRADAFGDRRFEAVVCDPPFQERNWGYDELVADPRWEFGLPPRGESELAWIQHCLSHADPGARVVVATSVGAASRRAGRRIRGNLLRAGVLRAVVGLQSDGTVPNDLWVLRRPRPDDESPSRVLMVVAPDHDSVVHAWRSFVDDPRSADGPHSRAVRIVELLDEEVDLSPARHVPTASTTVTIDPVATRDALVAAIGALVEALPTIIPANDAGEAPTMTIGELAKGGVVTLAQPPLRMEVDGGPLAVLTLKDLASHRAPTGSTVDQPGLVRLAAGDVVVPTFTGPTPIVRVITEPGAVLGPRLVSIRADDERLAPHFLAGILHRATSAASVRSSSGIGRTDVRRVEVPLLPVETQRVHGDAFRRLAEFRDLLRDCGAMGEEFVRACFTGLAAGRLVPGE